MDGGLNEFCIKNETVIYKGLYILILLECGFSDTRSKLMLQSLNPDSISDDALFGSGIWNGSSSSAVRHPTSSIAPSIGNSNEYNLQLTPQTFTTTRNLSGQRLWLANTADKMTQLNREERKNGECSESRSALRGQVSAGTAAQSRSQSEPLLIQHQVMPQMPQTRNQPTPQTRNQPTPQTEQTFKTRNQPTPQTEQTFNPVFDPGNELSENPRLMQELSENPRLMQELSENPRLMQELSENPRLMQELSENPRLMQGFAYGGARAKTVKNKENTNKNSSRSGNNVLVNGSSNDLLVPRNQFSPPQHDSSKWEPKLQFKQYNDGGNGSLTKVPNQTKQKKQNRNENESRNFPVLTPANRLLNQANSSAENQSRNHAVPSGQKDSLMEFASIPLPAGIDATANPAKVRTFYKPSHSHFQNIENDSPEDLQTDFHSVNHYDDETTVLKLHNRAVPVTVKNNLWGEQNVRKKQSNETLALDQGKNRTTHIRVDNSRNCPDKFSHNSLQLNSELDNPIVVPYQHNISRPEGSLAVNSMLASAGSSPNAVTTITFSMPSSTHAINSNSFTLSDSLSTSLSSNVLFGDGENSDYLFAQSLQRKYDEENKRYQLERELDIGPDNSPFVIPPDQPYNQSDSRRVCANYRPQKNQSDNRRVTPPYQLKHQSDNRLVNSSNQQNTSADHRRNSQDSLEQTADFLTALEYQTLSDSLTSNQQSGSVYVPEDQSIPEHIYIPLVNQSEANSNRAERPVQLEELVISHGIENEEFPESLNPRDPIVVRFDNASDSCELPTPAFERNRETLNPRGPGEGPVNQDHGLVPRGVSGWREAQENRVTRHTQEDDEELARLLQEEQDEQLARILQEQEGERQQQRHSSPVNHRRMNNIDRSNRLPLHTRFGQQSWRNRPLRVGPTYGGLNVADSHATRIQNTWDRPLQQQRADDDEYAYLNRVHNLPVHEGYDIPPTQDYYYRYMNDPDLMLDDNGEDRLISINRDPQLLATLLMTRAPNMLIPNHIDLNDYEALWELAENLGEVRRVGMDQNDISLLPVHTFQAAASANKENQKTECSVCLTDFTSGEQLRTLPCCHIYHKECIDEWLRRNAICPVCRQSAKPAQ